MTAPGATPYANSANASTRNGDDDPTRKSSNAKCRNGTSNAPTTPHGPNPPCHPPPPSNHPNLTVLRLGGYPGDDFTPPGLVDLMRRVGIDRVLYGTNYPMVDARAYAHAFRALPLEAEELRAVATENAVALYPLNP